MATPTIEAISTQDITIDADYELEIGITNDPEEVTVGGLLEGFHYSWDADNDMLTIAGEATRLLGDAIWVVSAKETSSSTAVTREITYNVVPTAPIIEEVDAKTIVKGVEVDIFVGIQNQPTTIVADGLLIGVKFENSSEDGIEGIRFSGTLPTDTNLTVDSADFRIDALSDGGEDTYNLPINIIERPPLIMLRGLEIDVLDATNLAASPIVPIRTFSLPVLTLSTIPVPVTSPAGLTIDANGKIFQSFYRSGTLWDQIVEYDSETLDGETAIEDKYFYIRDADNAYVAINSEGIIYGNLENSRPFRVDSATPNGETAIRTLLNQFNFGDVTIRGMSFNRDDELFFAGRTGGVFTIYVIGVSADSTSFTNIRSFELPSSLDNVNDVADIAVGPGGELYLISFSPTNIIRITDSETANNATAVISNTYDLTGVGSTYRITTQLFF